MSALKVALGSMSRRPLFAYSWEVAEMNVHKITPH
jgi:hypothetical protein